MSHTLVRLSFQCGQTLTGQRVLTIESLACLGVYTCREYHWVKFRVLAPNKGKKKKDR